MSNKPLRAKDLIPVRFTRKDGSTEGAVNPAEKHPYVCPVTHSSLTNSVRCCVLKPTGRVVSREAVETLMATGEKVKKDMPAEQMSCADPFTGKQLKAGDVSVHTRFSIGVWCCCL